MTQVVLITGDAEPVAASVAAELGIAQRLHTSPQVGPTSPEVGSWEADAWHRLHPREVVDSWGATSLM